jgi:hypothetical protein
MVELNVHIRKQNFRATDPRASFIWWGKSGCLVIHRCRKHARYVRNKLASFPATSSRFSTPFLDCDSSCEREKRCELDSCLPDEHLDPEPGFGPDPIKMATAPLTLYSARICPWAQRATLALQEVGVQYEHIEIDLQVNWELLPTVFFLFVSLFDQFFFLRV